MSIYFLEHDLFIASTYNSNGYLILDSCIGEYGGYFRHAYLYYSELEAIQMHVKRFHELNLTMDEIQHEIETNNMEETA